MAIDVVQIVNDNLYSIIILIFSSLFLYFGKIIQDIQVNEGDKFDLFINGFMFIIMLFVLPLLSALLLIINNIQTYDQTIVDILIFIQIATILPPVFYVKEYSKKRDEGKSIKKERYKVNFKYILPCFIISIINCSITLYSYGNFKQALDIFSLTYLLLSLIILIFTFTALAGVFGYNHTYYPTVTVHMNSAPYSNVKLIKYGKTVRISHAGKPILINKENIDYIEILD